MLKDVKRFFALPELQSIQLKLTWRAFRRLPAISEPLCEISVPSLGGPAGFTQNDIC